MVVEIKHRSYPAPQKLLSSPGHQEVERLFHHSMANGWWLDALLLLISGTSYLNTRSFPKVWWSYPAWSLRINRIQSLKDGEKKGKPLDFRFSIKDSWAKLDSSVIGVQYQDKTSVTKSMRRSNDFAWNSTTGIRPSNPLQLVLRTQRVISNIIRWLLEYNKPERRKIHEDLQRYIFKLTVNGNQWSTLMRMNENAWKEQSTVTSSNGW